MTRAELDAQRARFEAWITAPPFERYTDRWLSDGDEPWPGKYCDLRVDLAWEAWCEALAVSDIKGGIHAAKGDENGR